MYRSPMYCVVVSFCIMSNLEQACPAHSRRRLPLLLPRKGRGWSFGSPPRWEHDSGQRLSWCMTHQVSSSLWVTGYGFGSFQMFSIFKLSLVCALLSTVLILILSDAFRGWTFMRFRSQKAKHDAGILKAQGCSRRGEGVLRYYDNYRYRCLTAIDVIFENGRHGRALEDTKSHCLLRPWGLMSSSWTTQSFNKSKSS